jgi:hypothetical protein
MPAKRPAPKGSGLFCVREPLQSRHPVRGRRFIPPVRMADKSDRECKLPSEGPDIRLYEDRKTSLDRKITIASSAD